MIEVDSEGRARIKATNKIIRSAYIIAAHLESREILYYYNGVTCSKELDISYNIITRRLNDGKAFISKSRTIKLIRNFQD